MRWLWVLVVVVACGCAQGQSAGWARVEALPDGTQVVVTTSHSAPCVLSGVSAEGMTCEFHGRMYWVDRRRIVRVTLERHSHAVAVGTAVGAAAGGALVASKANGSDQAKTISVLLGMGLGGWLGYGIGHLVPRSEGTVVYDGWLGGP